MSARISFFTFLFIFIYSCLHASEVSSPFEVMPWKVGQFAVYQIISMEGEDTGNRYAITLTGEEVVEGRPYFWMTIDIWSNSRRYGHNTVMREDKKSVSFKALVPVLNTEIFSADFAAVIARGVFPGNAIKLSVQFEDGPWYPVDPKTFFSHQEVIEDTPYSLTPHSCGRINYNKLLVDKQASFIKTETGDFACYYFSVDTGITDEFCDEGFGLWRSGSVPILGIVRMEFSKTNYWEKWEYQYREKNKKNRSFGLRSLYEKRVPGRRRSDTCTAVLIDYGT